MVVTLLLLQGLDAMAGHITGNSITYSCINTCSLRVEFRAYRDCSSPINNITPLNTLSISAAPGCVPPTPVSSWQNSSNVEVTPVCPGTATQCSNPSASISGVMEHFWVREYDFCAANCSQYVINWTTCCRNAGITTIANPASVALYASTTFNPFLTPCNSSPSFTSPPVAYICQGQTHVIGQGASDPDGDSLSYAMGPCLRNATQSVPYLAFTSPSSPLGPDWSVSLNTNGDLSLTPNPGGPSPGSIQVGVICVYVTEWRNGTAINTIQRDMQVSVIACPPNNQPVVQNPNLISGGSANGFTLTTCVGGNLCADFRVADSDAGQVQTMTWDQSLAGATFVSTANPTITDTISGSSPSARFCWTPTQAGTYSFIVRVQDDACPIVAQTHAMVTIIVNQLAVDARFVVSGCHPVSFCAEPRSGIPPFHYSWQGAGGLGLGGGVADSCFTHSFPGGGNFPFSLTISDAWGCTATTQDTVVITNNVLALAGPDLATCPATAIQLGDTNASLPNAVYSWTPSTNLNSGTIAAPVFYRNFNGASPVMQNLILSVTDTATGCTDRDTVSVTIYPTPSVSFTLPDTTCLFLPVLATGTASGNGVPSTFHWQAPTSTPATVSGHSTQSFTFGQGGFQPVSVQVVQYGCSSAVALDSVWVQSGPVAEIDPVADQCITGNNFSFSFSGTTSVNTTYQWTFGPGASLTGSTQSNPGSISFASSGPKFATLQLTENGCPGPIDTLHFQVLPAPNSNWMVIGGTQCFDGNQFQFQSTGNNGSTATYSWSFQDGTPAISNLQNPVASFSSPGMKTVTLTVSTAYCSATHTDSVEVFEMPVVEAGPNLSFCEGDPGVQGLAVAVSGNGPFYYQWNCVGANCGLDSIHDNDPVLLPSGSAWFYTQIIDANGCYSLLDSMFVTVHPRPVADAGPDRFICGDTASCQILTGSLTHSGGAMSYSWMPTNGLTGLPSLTPCALPDTTTTYTLVATDLSTGCQSANDTHATVTVSVSAIPTAEAGQDLNICPGDTAMLFGQGQNAGPTYSYLWGPATGVVHPNKPSTFSFPLTTTHYTFSVWSNGCAAIPDTITVNVHSLPTVDAGGNREICLGDSTLLDATAIGDSSGTYSYVWLHGTGLSNPNAEDPIAVPQTTTTYVVVATSAWGCQSPPDSVQVHLLPTPVADAGPDLSVCEGNAAQLSGSFVFTNTDSAPFADVHFAWATNTSFSDTTSLQPGFLPTHSAWFHLTASYGSCSTTDSVYLDFVPALNAQIIADTSRICQGDTVQLTATGGHGNSTAAWFPSSSLLHHDSLSTFAFPDTTTTYFLILTESGCNDTAQSTIHVLPRPVVDFTHSPLEGCMPFPVNFVNASTNAGLLVWDFGDGSPVSNEEAPIHLFETAGQFVVMLTGADTGMCASKSAPVTVIVHPSPAITLAEKDLFPQILYLPNAALSLTETSVQTDLVFWDFGDGKRGEGSTALHTYMVPGIYEIQVIGQSENGCVDSMTFGPVIVAEPQLEIPNVFSPNGDGINDEFMVKYEGNEPFFLQVNDRWGRRLFETRDKLTGWPGKDPEGVNVPEGVYFYTLEIGGRPFAGPVTLMR